MKRLFPYLIVIFLTFVFSCHKVKSDQTDVVTQAEPVATTVREQETKSSSQESFVINKTKLDWKIDQDTSIYGYDIRYRCAPIPDRDYVDCDLTISKNGKIITDFAVENGYKEWLQYALFDFTGTGKDQLIVHSYSGGAHCCYDYTIYELTPKFRILYDSSKLESANQIGNRLHPIDIDGDGIYEFYQDVMAFDYMAPGGHATSTFPPAIFAYDQKTRSYILANKNYPNFILKQLDDKLKRLPEWREENNKYGAETSDNEIDEIIVRETFLYWVYAGKRDEAWEYFKGNYRTKEGNQYQDQFREKFISEFEELFRKDPTYLSIYGSN